MLRLERVTKIHRSGETETTALDRLDLVVEAGEFVAIVGPSGCGKSTLLNVLGMLDRPTSGAYRFAGEDVTTSAEARLVELRKHQLGFIFQSFNLIDELTVADNIELALIYQGVTAAERGSRVTAVLDQVGLAHRARHVPAQLSGGQQQRVSFARAVVGKPSLLLADEPTGNLDSAHGSEIMRLLRELNDAGSTVVMVTHSRAHADCAHRVIELFDGRVVSDYRKAA